MTGVPENTEEKQRPAHWFKPGVSGNPAGKPKGARHKLSEQFVAALQADFQEHGKKVIEDVRKSRPQDYLKVLASILPKELNVNTNALGDMDDDELAATLAAIRHLASQVDSAIAGAGAEEASGTEPASTLRSVQ